MKKIDLNRELFLTLGFMQEVDDEGFESLVKTYDNGATAEYNGTGFTVFRNGKNIQLPMTHHAHNICYATEEEIRFLDKYIADII